MTKREKWRIIIVLFAKNEIFWRIDIITMDKNAIFQVLRRWNFWGKDLADFETGVWRESYLAKIELGLSSGQILVITGVRRSGKSFLLRQTAKRLAQRGKPKQEILIVNFEDPRLDVPLDANSLEAIYQVYIENLKPEKKPVVILDEIQEVDKWEKWVRMMHELQKATIIISGSNSDLLSGELATSLTGRHSDVVVFPLSYSEFIRFNPDGTLEEFLEKGGFPAAVCAGNANDILAGLANDIIEKDIIKRFKIRKEADLKSLFRFYFSNFATLTSFNSTAKFLNLTKDTVAKFNRYFEKAYLTFFLKRFSYKVKEQEKAPRKVYVIDAGLAQAAGFQFMPNMGSRLENAVFLHLLQNGYKLNENLFYYRGIRQEEVDFYLFQKDKSVLIQVSAFMTDEQTKKREFSSLVKAAEKLQCHDLRIVTMNAKGEETYKGKKIRIMPVEEMLKI